MGMTYASETLKGPRTLYMIMQKMQLAFIHTAIICHNCSDFATV